jgi:hypothetical protein
MKTKDHCEKPAREYSWGCSPPEEMRSKVVTPAQAGVHAVATEWIPAFAGMTYVGRFSGERDYVMANALPQDD